MTGEVLGRRTRLIWSVQVCAYSSPPFVTREVWHMGLAGVQAPGADPTAGREEPLS